MDWTKLFAEIVVVLSLACLGYAIVELYGPIGRAPEPAVITQPVPLPRARPQKPVYHRVLKGGGQGAKVDCALVPQIAKQYSQAQVESAMRYYGIDESRIALYRSCLN